jgi:hypothetical protein
MDFVIYMTMAIFVISFTYILYTILPRPELKKKEFFSASRSSYQPQLIQEQSSILVDNIQPTSYPPPEPKEKCEPEKSPWFDHRIIGFCEDERLTTPSNIFLRTG